MMDTIEALEGLDKILRVYCLKHEDYMPDGWESQSPSDKLLSLVSAYQKIAAKACEPYEEWVDDGAPEVTHDLDMVAYHLNSIIQDDNEVFFSEARGVYIESDCSMISLFKSLARYLKEIQPEVH